MSSGGPSLSEVHSTVAIPAGRGRWRRVMAFLGPAYLVSVGYMDPGNWATDIAGGSAYGYRLIWVLLMSNLMALLLQSLSARLGIVRGLDLAQASRHTYPPVVNIPLYLLAEVAIAACDLAEVVGLAIGLKGAGKVDWLEWSAFGVTLYAGLSMVTNAPFYSFKVVGGRRTVPFVVLVAIALGIVLIALDPPRTLFAIFCVYALSGYAVYGWRRAKGQRTSVIAVSTDEPEEKGLHP